MLPFKYILWTIEPSTWFTTNKVLERTSVNNFSQKYFGGNDESILIQRPANHRNSDSRSTSWTSTAKYFSMERRSGGSCKLLQVQVSKISTFETLLACYINMLFVHRQVQFLSRKNTVEKYFFQLTLTRDHLPQSFATWSLLRNPQEILENSEYSLSEVSEVKRDCKDGWGNGKQLKILRKHDQTWFTPKPKETLL